MTFVTHSGIPATATITIEGPTPSTLTGGILTADSTAYPVSVTPAEDNPSQFYLSIPALPLGLHLLHLIIDGATTLYTHISTRPTPLAPSAGPETLAATITTTTTPATLTVNLNPGPAGPQGPKGETGDVTPAATAAAAAATASADRAAQQATEATSAATLAAQAADDATAAKNTATTAASAAASSQTAAANSADRAAQQATQATTAATTAQTAQTAAETARNVAVQAAAVYDTHAAALATTTTPGHVKLGTSVTVPDSAGMVGTCSNGGLGVRLASTNPTSGVGCVRLATSITDTATVSVPTASLVAAALHGANLNLLPDNGPSPSEGEWQALHIPHDLLHSWPIARITIPVFLTAQTTPLYLAAYAVSSSGDLTLLSVSTNASTWAANEAAEWAFNTPISVTSGYNLRLFLITATANAGSTSCTGITGHVKSYYIPTGTCSVRYSGVWYGNRTPQITLTSAPGHSSTAATASTPGHVLLATGADDTRPTAVITATQFAALLARVTALETAAAANSTATE